MGIKWEQGGRDPKYRTQPVCSALSCPASPLCSTEDLYLGRGTAEDGNARARAGHPGARIEWARHQATPGLTVSAKLEILDP